MKEIALLYVEQFPYDVVAYNDAGISAMLMKDLKTAKEYCQKIIDKNGENAQALSLMGKLAAEEFNYVRAIKYTKDALMYDPENFDYYMDLGTYYHEQGKNQDAIEAWKKAVEIQPDYFLGYAYLAMVKEITGPLLVPEGHLLGFRQRDTRTHNRQQSPHRTIPPFVPKLKLDCHSLSKHARANKQPPIQANALQADNNYLVKAIAFRQKTINAAGACPQRRSGVATKIDEMPDFSFTPEPGLHFMKRFQ